MPEWKWNKVKYGLKNVHYAPMSGFMPIIDGGGVEAPSVKAVAASANGYGKPIALPGAISLSLSPSVLRRILSADDTERGAAESLVNYTGDLTLARIPEHFLAYCLGTHADYNGVSYETCDPVMSPFALLFEFDGDVWKTRHVLYNCYASHPAIAGQTVNPDDGPDPSQGTETLTITVAARPDNLVKARVGQDNPSVYDAWFERVYLPVLSGGWWDEPILT